MNYFELFEIPIQLKLNKETLKKKYFELSRLYHPDYFIQQNEQEQINALDKSALLNKAFKTFNNEDDTIRYVLELKGLLAENEKYELPPDFLMEIMELNEALSEAGFAADHEGKEKMYQTLEAFKNELYQPVAPIVLNYKEGLTTEKELLQLKDYYFKKKYIDRLERQLNEKL